jgi:hypothetical protein
MRVFGFEREDTPFRTLEDAMNLWSTHGEERFGRLPRGLIVLAALSSALLVAPIDRVAAQHSDAHSDGNLARSDAMFGMPDRYGTVPPDNIFATTPGLEQQARRSQFTVNVLAPIFFNSNGDLAPAGGPAGTNSAEFSPIAGVSWSTPVFDLPLRFTANARAEVDRFTQVPAANFDKVALSGRLQYIDPTNDQSFSPYFAYAPRFDFDPFFKERFATRQDLNLGVNKTFNFDRSFGRVAFAPNTLADTVWSLGVTTFAQRRFRDPEPSSWAFYLIPSVTYVINEQWNVSLGAEFMFRTFDPYLGFTENEWFLEPIATLEFVLPSSWFGSDRNATLFGRPAIDLQMAYEQNWSNIAAFTYGAMHVGAALKLGWRF